MIKMTEITKTAAMMIVIKCPVVSMPHFIYIFSSCQLPVDIILPRVIMHHGANSQDFHII
jgi:hypothetical protein